MSKKTKSVSFKEMMKHGINPLLEYTKKEETPNKIPTTIDEALKQGKFNQIYRDKIIITTKKVKTNTEEKY